MKHINLSSGWFMDDRGSLKVEVAFGKRRGKYESITFPLEGVRTSRIYTVVADLSTYGLEGPPDRRSWSEKIFEGPRERAEVVAADFRERSLKKMQPYEGVSPQEAEDRGKEFQKHWKEARSFLSVRVEEGLPILPENSFLLEDTGEVLKNGQHRWKIRAGEEMSKNLFLFAGGRSPGAYGTIFVEEESADTVIRQATAAAGGVRGLEVAALLVPGRSLRIVRKGHSLRGGGEEVHIYSWDGIELSCIKE